MLSPLRWHYLISRFDGVILFPEWKEGLRDKFVATAPRPHRLSGQQSRRSQASLAQPSRELGIMPKTAAKWRNRATVEHMKTGPSEPRSTVLSEGEGAMVVAVRRHRLLPSGDCLYAL